MTTPLQLKLKAVNLSTVRFRLNKVDKNIPKDYPLGLHVEVIQEAKQANFIACHVGFLGGDIEAEKSSWPFDVTVVYVGLFDLGSSDFSEEEIKRIGGINCAAIIFPFLREEVANLTLKGTGKPLLLPPVNFVELYKKQGIVFKREIFLVDVKDINTT